MAGCRKIFLVSILGIFLSMGIVHAAGIGISPAKLYFDDVLKGGYAEKEIIVQNTNDYSITYDVFANGLNKDWIAFRLDEVSFQFEEVLVPLPSGEKVSVLIKTPSKSSEISTFTVPAKTNTNLIVVLQPPNDAANGEYDGHIYIVPSETDEVEVEKEEGGVAFGLGIEVGADVLAVVNITGKEILDYVVESVSVRSTEIDYPITFSIKGRNLGNVRVTPKIGIDILNQNKTEVLISGNFSGDEVWPTTSDTTIINISSDKLPEGQYWADVKVYVGGNVIKQQLLTFDLMPEGALTTRGELKEIRKPVWAKVGEVLKIEAIFENQGELPVLAKFKGEILLEGDVVKTLESDELNVPVGDTASLTTYFTPKKAGRYIVSGYVVYSKKYTFTKEGIINVESKRLSSWVKISLILFAILIIRWVYYYYTGGRKSEVAYVSNKYKKIDENLEKMIRESKRLKDKIKKLKRRSAWGR